MWHKILFVPQYSKILKTLREFFLDHSLLHYASSLSFHTVLALIPMLIISFFVFSQFAIFTQFLEHIKEFLFSSIVPAHQDQIVGYIEQFIQNRETLGYVGMFFVLYVSVMFFDNFEYVINKIFKTTPRRFFYSISIYLTLSILAPIALGLSLYLSIEATIFIQNIQYVSSYLIAWLLFFMLYKISANRQVYFKSALISSWITSTVWFVSKTMFIYYVAYNKTYLSIYGSFSTVMFFLIWIYLSWIIFLYGAKLCYVLNQKREKLS